MLVRINATAASIGIQASHVEPPSTFSFEGLHSLGSGASVGRPRMVNVQCDEPGGAAHLKNLPPYSIDSPTKVWYSTGKAPSVHYLRALLQADEILKKGQPVLHHLQSQSYYILLERAHLSA